MKGRVKGRRIAGSDFAFAALALALHLGGFTALVLTERAPRELASLPSEHVVELDPAAWEEPAEETPAAPSAHPAIAAGAAVAVARPAAATGARAEHAADRAEPSGAPAVVGGGDTLEQPTPAPTLPERAPLSLDQLGVAGPTRSVTGLLAPERETAARTSETALKDSITRPLAERDRELGLGPEGPVIEELLRDVYASSLNLKGKVTFRASFDERGRIVSLSVVSCDGERALWEELGAKVKSDLTGKEGRHTTNGYESDIEVETALKNPSGTDPGAQVELFGFTLKDGGGPESTKIQILTLKPQLQTVEFGGEKIQVPVVMFSVFAARGDLSDIGSHSRRVVHARVVHKPRVWKLPPGVKPNSRWDLSTSERDRLDRKIENGGAQIESKTPRL